jgi:MFS family permease
MHGILLPILAKEFDVESETSLALVGSLTGLGMMLGASFFAVFSNTYGRRLSFQISLFLCALFGFVSSFCLTLESFSLARCGLGFGYGGNLVVSLLVFNV